MSFPIHRYFLDGASFGGALRELPFSAWNSSLPAEIRYPYDVLERALPSVEAQGLHFYFTKNAYFLPEYGPHVVAVLLQEERCKVPVYGRHVRATIRNLTSKPYLGFHLHSRPGQLEAVLLFEYLRDWYTHMASVRAFRQPPPAWGISIRREPVVIELPLGYHSQVELPQVHMADRPIDAFFAGQIKHEIPRSDYRYWISTSKFAAREQLWKEMKRLQRCGNWRLDLDEIAATDNLTRAAEFNDYSVKMIHTRICVAPRGTTAPTYRAFEGLRAGCLVVTNRLPNDAFLSKAPILQINHWRELEGILRRYARNLDLLEDSRAKSLEWWHTRLSPDLLANIVARELNRAGSTLECSI